MEKGSWMRKKKQMSDENSRKEVRKVKKRRIKKVE